MNHLKLFEEYSLRKLIHVTSLEIANIIKEHGFIPIKNDIEYKYYSEFGNDGIYFYDNIRLVQQYAYFLKNKLKLREVVLIYCEAPVGVVQSNDKTEDGLFISKDNLNLISIDRFKVVRNPIDLY